MLWLHPAAIASINVKSEMVFSADYLECVGTGYKLRKIIWVNKINKCTSRSSLYEMITQDTLKYVQRNYNVIFTDNEHRRSQLILCNRWKVEIRYMMPFIVTNINSCKDLCIQNDTHLELLGHPPTDRQNNLCSE